MAIYRRILIHPRGGGGIKQERFFFGGAGSPVIASAATCISASQPAVVLNIDLAPVIEMLMSPNAIIAEAGSIEEGMSMLPAISESVPIGELSGPIPKVDEELT